MKQPSNNFVNSLMTLVKPTKLFSSHTLILLSFFSCALAALATDIVRELLSTLGWIFLILGVAWKIIENPPKIGDFLIGPWIIGALVSIFLFGKGFSRNPSSLLLMWPLISAAIAGINEFVTPDVKFKRPKSEGRQRLVLLFLSNLVISCWLQFHFVLQGWFQEYPSLLAEDFSRSAFVTSLNFQAQPLSRGYAILAQMESLVIPVLNDRPWSEVEQWLLRAKQQPEVFGKQVMEQFLQDAQPTAASPKDAAKPVPSPLAEDVFWRVAPRILPGNPYTFQGLAIWNGPGANAQGYYLIKSCPITEMVIRPNGSATVTSGSPTLTTSLTSIGKITCGDTSRPIAGQPPALPE
ncbi:MAG: DUF5357 family protein [Leptolyngbyaceae bacterium]|nr:DUF5357 family protein [Leptolyngbyaceae bacterium]